MAFNPREVAEIIVNGARFRDWESVVVILVEGESNNSFRFTVSEGAPLTRDWSTIKIRPGDHCTIKMAGELAITGYVETRKVAYTAAQHGIEISGVSYTKALADGAASTKGMEFRDKPLTPIIQQVCKPFGIKFVPKGNISQKPFDRASITPGEPAWPFIEGLCRMRGVTLGTDAAGNLTGRMTWDPGGGDSLIEGKNILEANETMTMSQGGGADQGIGQDYSSDKKWGPKSAQSGNAQSTNGMLKSMGSQGVYSPNVQRAERPVDQKDMSTRTNFESQRRGQEQLQVNVTVQGWLRPSGGLWMPGKKVHVTSPMLIVDEDLDIKKVTLTQDNKSGTRTTLDLKRDEGGDADKGIGQDYTSKNTPATPTLGGPGGGIGHA